MVVEACELDVQRRRPYARILIRSPSTIHSRFSSGQRSGTGNVLATASSTRCLSCRASLSTMTPEDDLGS